MVDVTGTMTFQVGTASWTAPEILMKQPYGFSADVYSLGIVLWEIATRKVPYDDLALG
jgi:serine/threonine protein kinase